MATPQPKLFRRRGTIVPPEVPRILTAAESNDVKALDLTLRYYAVNERDESGMTPLHYAAGTLANQALTNCWRIPIRTPQSLMILGGAPLPLILNVGRNCQTLM